MDVGAGLVRKYLLRPAMQLGLVGFPNWEWHLSISHIGIYRTSVLDIPVLGSDRIVATRQFFLTTAANPHENDGQAQKF